VSLGLTGRVWPFVIVLVYLHDVCVRVVVVGRDEEKAVTGTHDGCAPEDRTLRGRYQRERVRPYERGPTVNGRSRTIFR